MLPQDINNSNDHADTTTTTKSLPVDAQQCLLTVIESNTFEQPKLDLSFFNISSYDPVDLKQNKSYQPVRRDSLLLKRRMEQTSFTINEALSPSQADSLAQTNQTLQCLKIWPQTSGLSIKVALSRQRALSESINEISNFNERHSIRINPEEELKNGAYDCKNDLLFSSFQSQKHQDGSPEPSSFYNLHEQRIYAFLNESGVHPVKIADFIKDKRNYLLQAVREMPEKAVIKT